MPNIHDPYLNTVRRSLNEEKIKSRKHKIHNSTTTSKSFLSKKIIISDYIHLPESFQKFILLNLFIFIPYIFGLLIIFITMGTEKFQEITIFNFDLFMLSWTVGYETIALILLLTIIKSAFSFKKKQR